MITEKVVTCTTIIRLFHVKQPELVFIISNGYISLSWYKKGRVCFYLSFLWGLQILSIFFECFFFFCNVYFESIKNLLIKSLFCQRTRVWKRIDKSFLYFLFWRKSDFKLQNVDLFRIVQLSLHRKITLNSPSWQNCWRCKCQTRIYIAFSCGAQFSDLSPYQKNN